MACRAAGASAEGRDSTSQIADDPGASLRFLVCATSFRPAMTSPCCTPCMSARRCLASKRCKPCPGLAERTTQKHDVFVLDFMNDTDTIQAAFATTPARRFSARKEEDCARLLETIDMDSYRVEKCAAMRITLADETRIR